MVPCPSLRLYILERFEMKASCPLPWSTEFKDAVTEYDLGVTGLI